MYVNFYYSSGSNSNELWILVLRIDFQNSWVLGSDDLGTENRVLPLVMSS